MHVRNSHTLREWLRVLYTFYADRNKVYPIRDKVLFLMWAMSCSCPPLPYPWNVLCPCSCPYFVILHSIPCPCVFMLLCSPPPLIYGAGCSWELSPRMCLALKQIAENWKVMRRFTLSTLRNYGMGKRTIEDKIIEECNVLTKTIKANAGGLSFPPNALLVITAAVSNIIVSILLGKRYDYEDPTFLRLLKIISENVHLTGTPNILLYNMFPMLGFLLGARKKVTNNRKEFHDFLQTTFIEYLKNLDENDPRNFIDSFLIRQREKMANRYFHNENLKTVSSNLFAAGTETTGSTLRWAILLMMKYPEIQSKVQEEIAKEIGVRQPRIEDRSKMPYTDAVIHEIQRFSDIVPTNLPHATTKDITFKGFFIPKGMQIVPLLSSVLRDESQWEKPYQFYPEHFLDSEGKFVKRDAFMPFSAGRRICAGETLAKMELFLFFTSLLQKFTFQPPPGISKNDLNLMPALGFTTPPMPYKTCAIPCS
uniref:Uncharacterized protein n=1 Tax=Pseudonaja textilis TaxID=8673 RepID=A0A670XSK0_PSETE